MFSQPDGSAIVEEKRTYKFDGDFHFAYLYINKDSGNYKNKNYEFSNFYIADEQNSYSMSDSENEGTFFVRDEGSRYYIKWFYDAANTSKTFTIKYTIENAVLVHKDIAEFYWKLIGDEWDKGVSFVEAKIYLPEGGFDNSSDG